MKFLKKIDDPQNILTQQQKLENPDLLLSSIIDSIHDAIISVNMNKKIIFMNKGAQTFSQEQSPIQEILENDTISNHFDALFEKSDHPIDPIIDEIKISIADQEVSFRTTITPLYSLQEQIIGGTLVIKEITREKKMKLEIEKAYQELESFSYSASHDLKQPLRGIQHYAGFLKQDNESTLNIQGLEQIDTIIKLAERMNKQLDDLWHFSKIGQSKIQKERFDVNDIINMVQKSVSPFCEEKNAEIIVEPNLPHITANQSLTFEVFQNLIINGLKYNLSQQPVIEVGCVRNSNDSHNESNVFYVKDNGIGIDPKFHHDIFQIFRRLHRKDQYGGGTGAGLSIVKRIIEAHDGKIWLDSKPEAGTTFYFTLSTSQK